MIIFTKYFWICRPTTCRYQLFIHSIQGCLINATSGREQRRGCCFRDAGPTDHFGAYGCGLLCGDTFVLPVLSINFHQFPFSGRSASLSGARDSLCLLGMDFMKESLQMWPLFASDDKQWFMHVHATFSCGARWNELWFLRTCGCNTFTATQCHPE